MDIYNQLSSLLPVAKPSIDDKENRIRIDNFRIKSDNLLNKHVDLDKVLELLKTTAREHWDDLPREVYNAFYCCISWHRHAYRYSISLH